MVKNLKNKKMKEIEEKILKLAIHLARDGEGALFVIGENVEYSLLIKQKMKPFNVLEPGSEKTLRALAVIDGAVIINREGVVVKYGAMIKKAKPFIGYGTRHAAAITASKNKNISIMCSEEEHKVKIFRNGRFIMQVDALQKGVEKNVHQITDVLESIGAGFIGTVGAAALAPALGIALLPGVIIFGGGYFAMKSILKLIKKIKK